SRSIDPHVRLRPMQNNDVPLPPKPLLLKSFQSGRRTLVLKREHALSRPSTSAQQEHPEKPVITEEVRELTPRISFNLRLIELVKHRRCLYDGATPGGRSSTYRMQIWEGLALMLDYDRGGVELQKRWKQIRDKYVKERRLVMERERKGLKEAFGNNCSWPLYNKMTFIDPFVGERDPKRSVSPIVTLAQTPENRQRSIISPKDVAAFNRRLISAVRSQPVLYSASDTNYRVGQRRAEAWHAVLTELEFPCDLPEIQRYWKSIRDRYIRTRRMTSDPSGLNSPPAKKVKEEKPWIHYSDLQWIDPFLDYRQRLREKSALNRQAADREKRGIVANTDEDDGVIVDYEVDREEVEMSVLYESEATKMLESGVRFDGDTAYAASVISDIRALPLELQAIVRAKIELELERAPRIEELQLIPEKTKEEREMKSGIEMIEGEELIGEEKN
ncbi:hypothetical protein PFISCL1PPCAC_5587, partial [Pristionchus fissidentatus]